MTNPDLSRILREALRPGRTVFVHAGPSESPALRTLMQDEPDLLRDVTLTGMFLPGINDYDYAESGARVVSGFVPTATRRSFEERRHEFLPLHYSALARHFAQNGTDLAILHCPPDRGGRYSMGLNADFGITAAKAARRRIVIVNARLPWTGGHEPLVLREEDIVVEDGSSPLAPAADEPDATSTNVAANVASLIRDGDTVQTGIGKIPTALLRFLSERRGLCVYSGLVTDGLVGLLDAGALDLDRPSPVVTGMAWGGDALHAAVSDPRVVVAPATLTHDLRLIAGIERFVAVNSAIEVDLLGQVNGEVVRGRRVSGIGGANDFARAAKLSPGGRSIIALPSTAGRHSRIVVVLAPGAVSQAAADADVVVTEQGITSLGGLTLDRRAEALIAIAAPEHRGELEAGWRELRARM